MDADILQVLLPPSKSDLKIHHKRVWGHTTQKPHKDAHVSTPVISPVHFVYCSYSTNSPGGVQRDFIKALGPRPRTLQVLSALKSIQVLDFRKKFKNIRYNFMIGGDGIVYGGRGWGVSPTLPAKNAYNTHRSVYIGFIGYWHDEPPDDKLFELRDEVIKIGIGMRAINNNYLLVNLPFPSVYRDNYSAYIR